MKKLGLLMLAVLMIGLSSCGGDNANKAKDAAKDAVQTTENAAKEAADKTAETAKDAAKDVEEAVAGKNGKSLFMENGCVACHQVDKKTVGPAVKTIATSYAGKKDDLVKFLKGEGKAIVDPAQFAVMKPNLATTKKLNDADLSALVDYMLSAK